MRGAKKFFRFARAAGDVLGAVHKTTKMSFPFSFFCRQPLPDQFFTWLCCDMIGYADDTSVSGNFAFGLNILSFPFNQPGGLGVTLPHPFSAVNAANPAGLKNVLYNSSTSTGIWNFYRVWATQVELVSTPFSQADRVYITMAPVYENVNAYGSVITSGQAPNSMEKMVEAGVSAKENTLAALYKIPNIVGQDSRSFLASGAYVGSFSAAPSAPVYMNVNYATADKGTLSGNLTFSVRLRFHVEFFQRVDTALLDN